MFRNRAGRVNVSQTTRSHGPKALSSRMWHSGVRLILEEKGINAAVQARNYGKIDSCEEFTEIGLDFNITFEDTVPNSEISSSDLGNNVVEILDQVLDLQLHSVLFRFPNGEPFLIDGSADGKLDQTYLALPVWPRLSTEKLTKKVYLLAYDPILNSGNKLTAIKGWRDYLGLANDYIAFFKEISGNRIHYSIAFMTEVNDIWLEKIDGFVYTEETYLDVIERGVPRHDPDIADYGQFMKNAEYDICGKLNRGEIDELWIFGGPWFGFNESRLAGPIGFDYNSKPYPGSACNELLPIMGFSYERSLTQMLESFGHRTEATMRKIFENWEQESAWGLFSKSALRASNVTFSGCGMVHFPPNAENEYNYTSQSTVESICDDFINYPSLSAPALARQSVSCSDWGCSTQGFFKYWLRHLPAFAGVAPDGTSNDWWQYIIDPNLVQSPFSNLAATTPMEDAAEFFFSFSGSSSGFYVDVSTSAEFSANVTWRFVEGVSGPLINHTPEKWDNYSPGQIIYWRVTSNSGLRSPIQSIIIADGK